MAFSEVQLSKPRLVPEEEEEKETEVDGGHVRVGVRQIALFTVPKNCHPPLCYTAAHGLMKIQVDCGVDVTEHRYVKSYNAGSRNLFFDFFNISVHHPIRLFLE